VGVDGTARERIDLRGSEKKFGPRTPGGNNRRATSGLDFCKNYSLRPRQCALASRLWGGDGRQRSDPSRPETQGYSFEFRMSP